jgi:hypothetical protein
MKLSDIVKDEILDELLCGELKYALDDSGLDPALVRSLHVVIAYFSVPGTHMEGAYDPE